MVLTIVLPWSIYDAFSEGWLGSGWAITFAIVGAAFMTRWCVIQGLAFWEIDRIRHRAIDQGDCLTPFVSILVPAHNESQAIIPAIESLISLNYPAFEVIVVDDGSDDDTFEKAFRLAGGHGHCTVDVFRKSNGGKASAMNHAFKASSGDYILCVDADSGLERDALRLLARRLNEPGVGAVCGQVSIRNRTNLLTRFQAIEYLMGNGGMRTALSTFGLVTVVPGPIGLYRREVLEEIAQLPVTPAIRTDRHAERGPFSHATFAEDFQLSLSALALGKRVIYEPRAKAMTKCPDRIDALLSQRYRWIRGTWQVYHVYLRHLLSASKEKREILNPVMAIIYPIDIYMSPILQFIFWIFLGMAEISGNSLAIVLSWIGSVVVLNIMAASIYVIAHDDDFSLLIFVPFLDLYQSLLVNSAWIIAAIDQFRGARMKW